MLILVLSLVYIPMLVEARRASRNERDQRARGGIEPRDDVYAVMRFAYPALFLAMIVEAAIRGAPHRTVAVVGLIIFLSGKALKWWAIVTLGQFWTFRVIVVPGAALVARGPYRFLRHPNYAGVVLELAGVALMTGAAISGPLSVVLFGVLLKKRVSVERRALASAARHPPCSL
jgi:methyltransferase